MSEVGSIDPDGTLFIERVNGKVEQKCPYSTPGAGSLSCNHHCPFFEELANIYDGEYGNRGNLTSIRISVCGKVVEINKDKRR